METIKICSKCGKELPATSEYFHNRKDSKDGLRTECKTCKANRAKQHYTQDKVSILSKNKEYRDNHKEQSLAAQRNWVLKNKEKFTATCNRYYKNNQTTLDEINKLWVKNNKSARVKHTKKYYENNKAMLCEKGKIRYQNYGPEYAQHKKEYRQGHPELCCMHSQRRRARRRLLPATLTVEQWEQIKKDFDGKCAYCGEELPLEQEHFIPVTKGGEYTHNNIIPACKSCNSSKGPRSFFEWYPKYKYHSKEREQIIFEYLNYDKQNNQQIGIL